MDQNPLEQDGSRVPELGLWSRNQELGSDASCLLDLTCPQLQPSGLAGKGIGSVLQQLSRILCFLYHAFFLSVLTLLFD